MDAHLISSPLPIAPASPASLTELAESQLGLVGRRQLRAHGFHSNTWSRMLSSGRWDLVAERVARLRGSPSVRGQAILAAILDCGGATVCSYGTGAAWWGLSGYSLRPIELCRTGRSRAETPLARVHQIRAVPEGWVTTLAGVPVARPELVALHLCATIHPERAERALDNFWRDGLLSWRSLDRFLDEMGASGRNGITLLRQLLEQRDLDHVPPSSNLEARAADVLEPLGLDLRRQVDLGGDRWSGRVDLYAASFKLIVEVQSEKYHTALSDVAADAARRARLEADGFTLVEVNDADLWTAPQVALARVRAEVQRLRGGSVMQGATDLSHPA